MVVVGIDQSLTSTGVCILKRDGSSNNETVETFVFGTTPNAEEILDRFYRYSDISGRLVNLIEPLSPTRIVIEELAFGSFGDATRNLAALQGVIICELLKVTNCPVTLVSPTSLKKFATGSGRAKKRDMLDSIEENLKPLFNSVKVKDGKYDIVDAFHLARWGVEKNDC